MEDVNLLTPHLNQLIIDKKWSFDLEDCDNILRVETANLLPNIVIQLLNEMTFCCQELEDIVVR